MNDFSKLFSPLNLAELQQAQKQLIHEMENRLEKERDRLFEEFAALARARGIAIHDVVQRMHARTQPAKCGTARRVRRPAPIKFRHPEQLEPTWTGRGKTPR
jgi:DNA-binding protein H-NS